MELSARAGRPVTLRGIAEVWRSTASVRDALARWNDTRPLPEKPLAPGTAPELQSAYDRVRTANRPLGEALELAEIDPALRPIVLRTVADRLF
jgi:hypothetical protein